MSIDKTIRIQDLPGSDFLNQDNLFVINDSDNITRNVTFENLLESITDLPGGINIPPTEPGRPGISFCPEDKLDCGTGIGSQGDCQLFLSVCGETIVEIGPGPNVGINGDLEIDGDLIVNKDTLLKGDVNIGTGCGSGFNFTVDSPTFINCDTSIDGNITIGTPTEACTLVFEIYNKATFHCKTVFNDDITIKPGGNLIIEDGDIILNGEIKPPFGGTLDVVFDNLIAKGDIELGDKNNQCVKDLDIYNITTVHCEMTTEKPVTHEDNVTVGSDISLDALTGDVTARYFRGDGSLLENLNIPDSMRFKGSIDVTEPFAGDLQHGNFYINIKAGDADGSFTGINGEAVGLNQIVYYVVIENVGSWGKGSPMDPEGLVTVNTFQEITGPKDFSNAINFTDYVQCPVPLDVDLLRITNVKYVKEFTANYVDPIINNLGGEFVTLNTDQTTATGLPILNAKTFNAKVDYQPVVGGTDAKEVVNVEYVTQEIGNLLGTVTGDFVTIATQQDGANDSSGNPTPVVSGDKKWTGTNTFTGYVEYDRTVAGNDKEVVNVEYLTETVTNVLEGLLDPNTGDYVTLHTVQNGTSVNGKTTPVIDAAKKFTADVDFTDGVTVTGGSIEIDAASSATYLKKLDGSVGKEVVNVEYLVDYVAGIVGDESRWVYTDTDILDGGKVKIKADSLYPVSSVTNIYTEGELQADKGVLFYKNTDIMTV